MNKRQKLVQEAFLDNEEAVIKRLKSVYSQALKDITKKSEELQNSINSLTMATLQGDMDEEAQKTLQSMIQSKVYQKQYQDALKKQVSSVLDNMQVEEFKTVFEYLNKCYEEGFMGAMYDIHGQGIPLIMPMDQEAMVRAVQLDSKISKGLYARLGEDVTLLKKKITAQVSRGISTGMSFDQVAKQLSDYTNIGFNNAVRIARTEGHRIQVQSGMDACYKAKEKGADVVKQWDSTLDGATRPSHKKVDGEIKELDEPFSNGLMYPGDSAGGASEVVNCRCALLQRARWALDEEELETLKERAAFFGLDKNDSFDDFKKKYLKAVENTIHTRQESIEMFKKLGIDIKAGSISDEVLSKYADFITGFENEHSRFFSANKQHLKQISIVDNIKGVNASGIYREKTNSIEIKASRIISKQGTGLSKSDDFELHGLAHEYGHYIANVLEKTCGITQGDVVQDSILRYFDGDIFKSTKDLKDCLSSYGSTSYGEAFAEAFAEAYTCEKPREFSRIFKEELEKALSKKKR